MHPEAVGTQGEDELLAQREAEARRLLESLLATSVVDTVVEQQNAQSATPETPAAIVHSHADGSVRSVDSIDALVSGGGCPAMKHMSHLEVAAIIRASQPNQHRIATRAAEPAKKEVPVVVAVAEKLVQPDVVVRSQHVEKQQREVQMSYELQISEAINTSIEKIIQLEQPAETAKDLIVMESKPDAQPPSFVEASQPKPVAEPKIVERPVKSLPKAQKQSTAPIVVAQEKVAKRVEKPATVIKQPQTSPKPRVERPALTKVELKPVPVPEVSVTPVLSRSEMPTVVIQEVPVQKVEQEPVAVEQTSAVIPSVELAPAIIDAIAEISPELIDQPVEFMVAATDEVSIAEEPTVEQQNMYRQFDELKAATEEPRQVARIESLEDFVVRATEILGALKIEANPGLEQRERAEQVLEVLFEELITALGLSDTAELRTVLMQSIQEDGYIADVEAALALIDEGLHEQKQLDNARHRLSQGLANARQALYDRLASLAVSVATS